MIKKLFNLLFAKYRDLSVSRTDPLETDKKRYFTPIIAKKLQTQWGHYDAVWLHLARLNKERKYVFVYRTVGKTVVPG